MSLTIDTITHDEPTGVHPSVKKQMNILHKHNKVEKMFVCS